MKSLPIFSQKISRFGEFFRYISGCACGLLIKMLLSTLLNVMGLPVWQSYLITHIILLLSSFFFHYLITFRRHFEGLAQTLKAFFAFSATVVFFKLLDYVFVVIGITRWEKTLFSIQITPLQKQLFHILVILVSSGVIFLLRYFCYRVLFRTKNFKYYTGNELKSVWLTHAVDSKIAQNAASGGMVTALLAGLLKRKEIDGALVSFLSFKGTQQPMIASKIVTSAAELSSSQGSIYTDFRFLSPSLLNELKTFPGKIAVVALPCQLKILQGLGSENPEIAKKIVLRIGLFCGHTSQPELLDQVLKKKGISPEELEAFRFRKGTWRGYAEARLANGETYRWPTAYYNLYQNLFIAAPQRCMSCFDHFAETADISTGDIWCQKYRFEKVKPSLTAIRTEAGERFFTSALKNEDLTAEQKTERDLFSANSRSVIFHKAIAARASVLKMYGITIPVPKQAAPARWNEKLAAKIIIRFYRMPPEKALKINRRILKFYLYLMKGLTSF